MLLLAFWYNLLVTVSGTILILLLDTTMKSLVSEHVETEAGKVWPTAGLKCNATCHSGSPCNADYRGRIVVLLWQSSQSLSEKTGQLNFWPDAVWLVLCCTDLVNYSRAKKKVFRIGWHQWEMVIGLDSCTGFDWGDPGLINSCTLTEFTVAPKSLLKCVFNFGVRSLQADSYASYNLLAKCHALVSVSVTKLMWSRKMAKT